MVLDHLENLIAYVPVDISKQRLTESAEALSREMPALEILPVCADYLQPFELPTPSRKPAHIAVYFPGSTIGNMQPEVARHFLTRVGSTLRSQRRTDHRRRSPKIERSFGSRLQRQRRRDRRSSISTCWCARIASWARTSISRSGGIAPSTTGGAPHRDAPDQRAGANRSPRRATNFISSRERKSSPSFPTSTRSKVSARSPPRPVSNSRASGLIRRSSSPFFILQRSDLSRVWRARRRFRPDVPLTQPFLHLHGSARSIGRRQQKVWRHRRAASD